MERSHAQMVSSLKKPGSDILKTLTPKLTSAAHMLTGVYDEHLELLQEVQVFQLTDDPDEIDKIVNNIKLEAGDLVFYLEGLHQDIVGSSMDEFGVQEAVEEYRKFAHQHSVSQVLEDLLTWVIKVTTPVKRHIYYMKEINIDQLSTLINALMGILEELLSIYGSSLEEAKGMNKEKLLKGRYKEGKFSDSQANARADGSK